MYSGTKDGQQHLELFIRSIARKLKEVITCLYLAFVLFWPPNPRKTDKLERVQQRATKVIRALENLACENKLWDWDWRSDVFVGT